MATDTRKLVEQHFCSLIQNLQTEKTLVDLLTEINNFKIWLTDIMEHNDLPAYLVRNFLRRIDEIEKSIATKDLWKMKMNLKWGAFQLEKKPFLLELDAFPNEMSSLAASTKTLKNLVSETVQINSDKVVNIKFARDCKININNAKFITISDVSNSDIFINTDTLYVNNMDSSCIRGITKNQVRLHNSYHSTIDVDTKSIVIEDSFDLKIRKTPDISVEDFNHPNQSHGEASKSFQWI